LELLADVLGTEQIDLCFIDETLIHHGQNDDLSCLNNYTVYSKERSFGSKKGGGKMTIVRPDLNHTRWDPGLVMYPHLDAERSWLLVHENDRHVAFCSVYCAAEVGNDQFKVWNTELYIMIQQEVQTIQNEGFECIILGDLNGHVGNDDRGIKGNCPDINYNGQLLRDFIACNNLTMINADNSRCSGLFTRSTSNSATCIDYVLADNGANELIGQVSVDTNKEILWGSDHASLLIELDMGPIAVPNYVAPELKIRSPTSKSASAYAATLDRLLLEQFQPDMDIEAKCILLQESAVQAARLTELGSCITKARKFSSSKSIRKLRTRCIKLDASITKRLLWAKTNNLDPKIVFPTLQSDRNEAEDLKIRFRDRVRQKKADKRLRLRLTIRVNTKQFWALVRKAERKKGSLSAIKDDQGNLITNRDLVERIVLEQLALIFSGKRSPIFTHRDEQLIKESQVKSEFDWKDWIVPENDPNMYEVEVCEPVNVSLVQEIIDGLKKERAPGVDNLTPAMLKLAGPEAMKFTTSLINQILSEGRVPESLQTGKMTLIDKKKPSLLVTGKRPLTVSSVLLSLITKIIHARMDPICEREGFYGPVQFGFRRGRSTSDCVFVLLAAIRKAKKKNHTISLAFCDIAKAYDSVNRELLYLKLESLGFGGRVKDLIQSMYYNDNVRVRLSGGLSNPLWFTRGVKQGCVLSPLLFSLYISGLGRVLHSMKEGVQFNGVFISALFFADDLVLISRTKRRGMDRLLRRVHKFCTDMDMKLAVEKTVILAHGTNQTSWRVSDTDPDIEAAMVAKYLGIEISLQGRNLIKPRESNMIGVARTYAHTIMGCTRSGLDRAQTAHRLWECCAIPGFLYGTEAMVVSKTTVRKLEMIQHMVAGFILQLPQSSSQVMGWMEAGLQPIQHRLDAKMVFFAHSLLSGKKDTITKAVVDSVLADATDPWTIRLRSILDAVGIKDLKSISKASLRKRLHEHGVAQLQLLKTAHSSLKWLTEPRRWFKLQSHINDSDQCATLNRVRAGDAGLGNRRPNHMGLTYKTCPWCLSVGIQVKLDEQHVILDCPASGHARRATGVGIFLDARLPLMTEESILKELLGGDEADVNTMNLRGRWVQTLLEEWKSVVSQL